jgi:hypothetical protein
VGDSLTIPLAYIASNNDVLIANNHSLYRIDLTAGQPAIYTRTFQELKEETFRGILPGRDLATPDLKCVEILTGRFELGRFDSALAVPGAAGSVPGGRYRVLDMYRVSRKACR